VPRILTYSAMRKNLTIFRKFQFSTYQAIRKLSWVDAKWAHIARYLFAIDRDTFAENDLKDAFAFFCRFAKYERHKMRRQRKRQITRSDGREKSSCHIDTSGWPRYLANFKIVHEEAGNEMH